MADAPQTPPRPLFAREKRELGHVTAGASTWWSSPDATEETPELRWPLSLSIYDRMRSTDTQVMSVLRAVALPVRGTTWRLDPNGARPEVVEHIARDLGLPIKGQDAAETPRRRGRFSWSEHLRLVLLQLTFGHAVFEQVYRLDEATGLVHLRKLAERPARTISAWNVAPDGGLLSIEQGAAVSDKSGVKIPVDKLVVYTYEREGAKWWGNSLLRAGYKNWIIKDRLLRIATEAIERNGMGVPVYTAAEGETDLSAGQDIAAELRAGNDSGASIPNGADLTLLGVSGQIPDALPWVRYHDESIARGVLAHFLNLGQSAGTGSWALGSTLGDFFIASLQALAEQIADTATAHIVEDLVDLNWGPDEQAPRIVPDEIGAQTAAIAQALNVLVQSGIITPDARLEAYIRAGLGIPAEDPQTARSSTAQPPPADLQEGGAT